MEEITRSLETARDVYDRLYFNTDALFNEPAPDPIVSFVIGGVLSVMGIGMWYRRVEALKAEMAALNPPIILKGNSLARAWISCAIDSDSPAYVTISYGAAAFLFLGGIQLDYRWTLLAMISFYFVSSLGESVRILLAFSSARSLADVVVTSDFLASKLRGASTQLKPSNVYEDLGRSRTVVLMVFITQVILIAFVCVDVFDSPTTSCRDGTSGCPVGGTLGSWSFYVLGIFMACVFQLGPKTNFGESEQNPAYWLQLLLATKQSGAKVTWYDPLEDKTYERRLTPGDWRTWMRFIMSFLINGVGFHILVHALPIQVAAQSSLTGVVFRAVGMMYLVDLDDTPGYTLTIVEQAPAKIEQVAPSEPTVVEPADTKPPQEGPTTPDVAAMDMAAFSAEAEKIIEEARAKLDALATGKPPVRMSRLTNHGLLAAGALANAGEFEDGDQPPNELENIPEETATRDLPLGDGKKSAASVTTAATTQNTTATTTTTPSSVPANTECEEGEGGGAEC